ncbi:cytochrome P450 [Lophiostoma macrostomum CBS 122681]|uniref:Cytochrome P450 n=1 Tax=Lophiostoma macrostomum CBS 122681 TaxID=1314788 RepID=A0A6A6SUF4_9PLEO|nr:cytochrome P450 [Lophiostoma macrostomum CBS 122681]
MLFDIILATIVCTLVYSLFLTWQHLFLSPISKFPGPKLAAATYWYEFYYDIILGGKYIWKVKEFHEKYGPVVRINPHELHVSDPAFWDVMYTASLNHNRRDKWAWQTNGIGIPASSLGTAPHALHRSRRAALSPFFSMTNVRTLLPVVQERVDALVSRLEQSRGKADIVALEYAFSAFTNDVVMQYCFGRSDHHIEDPNFAPAYHNASFNAGKSISLLKHMNWILTIIRTIPEWVTVRMNEELSGPVIVQRTFRQEVAALRRQNTKDKNATQAKTIFHTLLESDLPESEKTSERLADEAILLIGAGTHTGSWCLTVLAFHLLSKPELLRRLKDELKSVMPTPSTKPTLQELEKLPLLTGVLKEGLRLGYGASVRSARIAPDTLVKCGDWVIPAGTPASTAIPITSHDETIFPDSASFHPDRWVGDDAKHLDKYLVAFSKGSRSCLGINLAWAEMYLCTAGIFSHFGSKDVRDETDVGILELFETDESDVVMESDRWFPVAKEGSKGVRVRISA